MGATQQTPSLHPMSEIALCRTKAHACRLALLRCGLSQDEVAARIPVTKGQMSNLLSGRRRWTDEVQFRFESITGSLAPSQWDARRRGLVIHADKREMEKAELRAKLERMELEDRAA